MADIDDMLGNVLDHLRNTFTTEEACAAWLLHPNPFLGNKLPVQFITNEHDLERLEAALEALDSGIFI